MSYLFFIFASLYFVAEKLGMTKVQKWLRRYRYRQNDQLIIRVSNELKGHKPYFRRLDEEAQDEFVMRVLEFMRDVRMIDQRLRPLDFRRRVLIAGSATQLTFGMNDYHISLHTVKVFDTVFKLGPRSPLMKGATSPNGVIYLSWPDVVHGMAVADDGLHLTIHEFAHALHLYHLPCKCSFSARMEVFIHATHVHYRSLRSGDITFLRDYGARNKHEFFAVCCEAFFEQPKQFKAEYPGLYGQMVKVLQQDPIHMSVNQQSRPVDWSERIGRG